MNILEFQNAEERWVKKEVKKQRVLHDLKTLNNITLNGKGELNLTVKNDKNALSLKMSSDFNIKEVRQNTSIHFSYAEENWEDYNRISLWIYPKTEGFHNFYFHLSLFSKGTDLLHAPSLVPNKWNQVVWEFPDFSRAAISKFSILPYLPGTPDEALSEVEFFITDLFLEEVKPDYVLGWDLENRIAYSHLGYLPDAKKEALTQIKADSFSLIDEKGKIVFTGKAEKTKSDLGNFTKMNFSEIKKPGTYRLRVKEAVTPYFVISDDAFSPSIEKTLNFLFSLNCGKDVIGVHSECHANSYTIHPDGRMLKNNGGWHDAADLSQFEICTAEIADSLLDLSHTLETEDFSLSMQLLNEARVGLNWLLKTRFGDGSRALAVSYIAWHNRFVDKDFFQADNSFLQKNVADSGPFENFISSAALAKGYKLFIEEDEVFAKWCLRASKEDFEFAYNDHKKGIFSKRWGKLPISQSEGAGARAAAELFLITKEERYLDIASKYAGNIMACQEKNSSKLLPFGGFFYEDETHEFLQTYEHRGHEENGIFALARLLEIAPNHPDKPLWQEALRLYAEYIKESQKYMEPYGVMPAQVYNPEKINYKRFIVPGFFMKEEEGIKDIEAQIKSGIKLTDNLYLRRMAVAPYRRGFHATLLSKTKAVSTIARVLNDSELRQTALDQLEWIFGKNPFASSTMTKLGYNNHPLYVAFSLEIEGALPVGIETFGNLDAPYWPVINNAVYKEIWGHTSAKYLWVLSDLLNRKE